MAFCGVTWLCLSSIFAKEEVEKRCHAWFSKINNMLHVSDLFAFTPVFLSQNSNKEMFAICALRWVGNQSRVYPQFFCYRSAWISYSSTVKLQWQHTHYRKWMCPVIDWQPVQSVPRVPNGNIWYSRPRILAVRPPWIGRMTSLHFATNLQSLFESSIVCRCIHVHIKLYGCGFLLDFGEIIYIQDDLVCLFVGLTPFAILIRLDF